MERDLGLYVCLCGDGTINRTLRSARGETELGDTTIGDALIDFSELNFENYAKLLDVIKLYDEETEIAGAENFGQIRNSRIVIDSLRIIVGFCNALCYHFFV